MEILITIVVALFIAIALLLVAFYPFLPKINLKRSKWKKPKKPLSYNQKDFLRECRARFANYRSMGFCSYIEDYQNCLNDLVLSPQEAAELKEIIHKDRTIRTEATRSKMGYWFHDNVDRIELIGFLLGDDK